MSNPHSGAVPNLEARVAELEKQLAKLQTVVNVDKTSVRLQAGTEMRITAPRVRIDAPGGVDIQPMLRTSIFHPQVIQGAAAIDAGKFNGMRITKVPPFILPF